MRIIGFVIFLFWCGTKGNCQKIYSLDENKVYIDSIAGIIKQTNSDSIKCLYSYRVALLHLKAQNREEYKAYLLQANSLKDNFPFLKDIALYYNSYEPYLKGDIEGFEQELIKANLALKKYNVKEAYRIRAIALQNIGILLQMRNKHSDYMQLLVDEAIPLAKKSGDNEIISGLYKGVGNVLLNTVQYEKAEEYLKQAEYYIEKHNIKSPTLVESKLDTKILYAEILVRLGKYDEAKQKLDEVYSVLKNYSKSNLNGNYYYVEGLYYSSLKDYEKALKSFDAGIIKQTEVQNANGINRIKFSEYQIYFELKQYEKAKDILEYLIQNNPQIIDVKNNYNELAKVYEAIGDSEKAYFYAKKYSTLNDSLNQSMFQEEILEMEARFNKVENENKIKLLESQKEKAEIIAKNNNLKSLLFGLLSVVLLLTVVMLWKLNSNQKRLNKQREVNHKQELAVLENQQKLIVAKALLEGEEVERKRIARDLHDGLGSMLSRLKMYLNKLQEEGANIREEINSLLDSTIKELRGVSQNLMPEALLKLGLEEALRDLCYALKTEDNKIEFQFLAQNLKLPKNKEIAIYRIIQELLNNALKYAKATEILVSCSQNKNVFYITVEDNGIGFDLNEAKNKEKMGLKNINYRVAFLEGKLEIDSHRIQELLSILKLQMNKHNLNTIVYKAIIVDDHPMVISGISSLMSEFNDIEIVNSFESGTNLAAYIKDNKVDIVLMDIFLPESNGIDLCKIIKLQFPEIIIIGMSSQSERSLVMQFIQNGGNGYILKSISLDELKECIYNALNGEIVFSKDVKKIISTPQSQDLDEIPMLSRREKDILVLLAEGKSTKEIADVLFLSFLTVQTHRRNILNKYQVKNVAELINFALKNRLI